jgi:thymidylate synthase ThyX
MPDPTPTKRSLAPHDPDARRIYPLSRVRFEYADGTAETVIPTPEQVAVAIAKCSRSDSPFDENILDVSLEKAAEFHERWVVGFGHGSVAEHAVASVAIENVSQVVIKILEDSRLASFTEKSSRYIVFTRERVALPKELREGELGMKTKLFLDRLYGLYDEIRRRVEPIMLERFPKPADMLDKPYAAITKARVCDVARSCLPAAAMGKLGMTANARIWGRAITKLASSVHAEAREVADELLQHLRARADELPDEALKTRLFPTLLKYAGHNAYLANLENRMSPIIRDVFAEADPAPATRATVDRPVAMVRDDAYAEVRIAAALLAAHSRLPIAAIQDKLNADPGLVERTLRAAILDRDDHDPLPREFEHAVFQHEIVMDYGSWRDVQRHRMCSQLNQELGTNLGFIIPEEVAEAGLADAYRTMMEEAAALSREIARTERPENAVYVIPMAYRRRLAVTWNVRELDHFITLRSGKKGHPNYRRIAQEIWRTLEMTHPLLAEIIRVDLSGSNEGVSTLGAKPKGF